MWMERAPTGINVEVAHREAYVIDLPEFFDFETTAHASGRMKHDPGGDSGKLGRADPICKRELGGRYL